MKPPAESGYSKTRVAVPRGNVLKWLFLSGVPNERTLLVGVEEKATSQTLKKGIFTLVLLWGGQETGPEPGS
jgi:hypothetical protein